jgi:hypothetical protein
MERTESGISLGSCTAYPGFRGVRAARTPEPGGSIQATDPAYRRAERLRFQDRPHLGGGAVQLLLARVGDHIGISGVGRYAVSCLAGIFRDRCEKTGWFLLSPRGFSVRGCAPSAPGSQTIGDSP